MTSLSVFRYCNAGSGLGQCAKQHWDKARASQKMPVDKMFTQMYTFHLGGSKSVRDEGNQNLHRPFWNFLTKSIGIAKNIVSPVKTEMYMVSQLTNGSILHASIVATVESLGYVHLANEVFIHSSRVMAAFQELATEFDFRSLLNLASVTVEAVKSVVGVNALVSYLPSLSSMLSIVGFFSFPAFTGPAFATIWATELTAGFAKTLNNKYHKKFGVTQCFLGDYIDRICNAISLSRHIVEYILEAVFKLPIFLYILVKRFKFSEPIESVKLAWNMTDFWIYRYEFDLEPFVTGDFTVSKCDQQSEYINFVNLDIKDRMSYMSEAGGIIKLVTMTYSLLRRKMFSS
jgi:hypothetical protein